MTAHRDADAGLRDDAASTGDGHVATDPASAVHVAPANPAPGDGDPIRVGRAAEALHMTNPTVGVGPLGGVALPTSRETVRTQRHLVVDGRLLDALLVPAGSGRHVLRVDGVRVPVVLGPPTPLPGGGSRREVLVDGFRFEVDVQPERLVALRERATRGRGPGAAAGPLQVKAIIPGKVVSVSVAEGDTVEAGQQLLAVEAMKMQNELRAPRDGTIERIGVAVGDHIEVGDLLVVIR